MSVALLASRYYNCLRGGSEDETIADSREGESERKLRRKVTCGGVFDVSGIMLRLRVRKKLSHMGWSVLVTRDCLLLISSPLKDFPHICTLCFRCVDVNVFGIFMILFKFLMSLLIYRCILKN